MQLLLCERRLVKEGGGKKALQSIEITKRIPKALIERYLYQERHSSYLEVSRCTMTIKEAANKEHSVCLYAGQVLIFDDGR